MALQGGHGGSDFLEKDYVPSSIPNMERNNGTSVLHAGQSEHTIDIA